jgi:hypothetical protein
MDFWNIVIPTLVFLAPALGIVVLGLRKSQSGLSDFRGGAVVFGVSILAALVGAFHFDQPVKLELLLPLSMEPSGYFEFAFRLYWIRFLWIAFSGALLLAFSLMDGKDCGGADSPSHKVSFLIAAFLFSALGFLSENTILSLMFIEITAFLLYAFGVRAEGAEGEQERVSYFKRSSFIFIGLLFMLALAATRQFSTSAIILLGLMLYSLSFLFSKNTFIAWRHVPLAALQAGTLFFLFGRIMREDMAPDLWIFLAGVFGVGAVVFSAFALIARSALGASFWVLFSFVGYLLFLRFFSVHPEDSLMGATEVIGLASAFSIVQFLRFGSQADQPWKKAAAFLLSGILLGIVSGAIPGADPGTGRSADPVRLVSFGLLTLLLALGIGKSLMFAFSSPEQKKPAPSSAFTFGLIPALVTIVAQVVVLVRIADIVGESPFRLGLGYLITGPFVIVAGAAVVIGLLAGSLLGSNARYQTWAESKEKKMEDLFPRIDPSIIRWNEWVDQAPSRLTAWCGARGRLYSQIGAEYLETADRKVFGDRLYRGFREYSGSLSLLLRYLHTGNVRIYLFLGALITLLGSLLFLLESR